MATDLDDQTRTPPDDCALMAAVAVRDGEALRALYDRHSRLVFTLCYRIVGDREEAEQVLLDAFSELWQRAGEYDGSRSSPRSYLLTVARSRALDCVRRRRARVENRGKISGTAFGGGSTGGAPLDQMESMASMQQSPLQFSVETEQAELVRKALDSLDPDQRRAIECAFYEGLSHVEVANQLREPLGTIKTRIRLGLIKLRSRLRRLGDPTANEVRIDLTRAEDDVR